MSVWPGPMMAAHSSCISSRSGLSAFANVSYSDVLVDLDLTGRGVHFEFEGLQLNS